MRNLTANEREMRELKKRGFVFIRAIRGLVFREHLSSRKCQLVKRAQNPKVAKSDLRKRSQAMSMMVGARGARSCEINVTPLIDVL